MKFLFVEDDELLRKSYSVYLADLFDEIIEAEDGQDGLDKYYKHKPDIIMLDISMPYINGMEVVKKIREDNSDVTIMILSAHSDKKYLFDAIELNIFKYLVKPLPRMDFKEAILKAIESRESFEDENFIEMEEGFVWDDHNKTLRQNGEKIEITKNEFKMLSTFCKKDIHYFTLMDLYDALYDYKDEFNENKIMMIIKRFRKKTSTKILKNIYGLGYKFNIKD